LLVRASGVFAVSPRRREDPSPGNPTTDGEASNPLGNEGLLPPVEKFRGSRQIADRVESSDCPEAACGRAQSGTEPRDFLKPGLPQNRRRILKETGK